MLWSSMDAAALIEFPGFLNRRKKVTLLKKVAKSYLKHVFGVGYRSNILSNQM
jgi:hypothetical protein